MKAGVCTVFVICFTVAGLFSQTFTEVLRLRINTKEFSEFGPFVMNGKMYFCSNRKTSFTANTTDGESTKYFQNIFEASDTTTYRITELPGPLNTIANDGPLCLGSDGVMYVSRNFASPEKGKGPSKVGIFIHSNKDGVWSEKVPFEHNNTSYNTGHPSLSNDCKLLFFSSDRPGGMGGFDIYWCRWENGRWSDPVNAGALVNSSRNEIFPFAHSSGKVFFSSDRDSTRGFDIYSSLFENEEFGSIEKQGEPLNSKRNDFSYWCDATGENGYFASDRKGSDDIYRFRSTFPVFESCDSMKVAQFCYTFFEENRYEIDTTLMAYEWDFGDKKVRSEEADYCFPGPGAYEVSLNIIDIATGDVYQKQASYMMEIQELIQPVITMPETIKAGNEIEFSAEKSNLPGFEILGYYWRFSDESKVAGSVVKHRFAKSGSYKVWLGVILKDTENNTTVKKCVFRDFDVIPER